MMMTNRLASPICRRLGHVGHVKTLGHVGHVRQERGPVENAYITGRGTGGTGGTPLYIDIYRIYI